MIEYPTSMMSKEAPGPNDLPVLGGLPFLWRDLLGYFSNMQRAHGNIAQYKLFNTRAYLISSPKNITHVFQGERDGLYAKSYLHDAFKPAFGDSLFNSYGEQWAKRRRKLQPYFQKSRVQKWLPVVLEQTNASFSQLKHNTPFRGDIVDVVLPLVQGIMSRILFGYKLEKRNAKKLVDAIQIVSEQVVKQAISYFFLSGVLNQLPTAANREFHRALSTIDEVLENMSSAHQHVSDETLVAKLRDEVGIAELRDELFTLFFAGQDTTVNSIAWSLYYIATHPKTERKLRAEIDRIIPDGALTYDHISQLDYTRCVISEAMRLRPPAYALYRNALDDDIIGGYKIHKNSIMTLCQHVTHRHPDVWGPKSNTFEPERFANNCPRRDANAYFPFGGGMRTCIGIHLGMMEITAILALFMSQFEFKLLPTPPVKPHTFMTLRPKNGVPLELHPRSLGKNTSLPPAE